MRAGTTKPRTYEKGRTVNTTVLAEPAVEGMSWLQVIVLSALQGLTEFLPVSSSGHLRIFSTWWFGADAGASFTAVVQLGTEAAVLVFFFKDIVRIIVAWFRGLFNADKRDDPDYRLGWFVIVGSIPIGIIGLLAKDLIRDAARNLWITAIVLILFSFVFLLAEKMGKQDRPVEPKQLKGLTMKDAIVMGLAQCLALIPGVSRSGGTISAGLFLNMSREAAARFSFLLAIPAVLASGLFSLPDAFDPSVGQSASWAQLLIGTAIAFVVGYAAIAWFLQFVQKHSLAWFAGYRVILGLLVMGLLAAGIIPAT
ncbi:undecaprenyl-diphosphate phosphatase [Dietzia aerolata]|nr:undecaprenyl-diphosphate phosphatase [Dietzia aerolata]